MEWAAPALLGFILGAAAAIFAGVRPVWHVVAEVKTEVAVLSEKMKTVEQALRETWANRRHDGRGEIEC